MADDAGTGPGTGDSAPFTPGPNRPKKKRRYRWLVALAALGLVAGVGYRYAPATSQAEAPVTFTADTGTFTAKVSSLGELRALKTVTVSALDDLPVIYLAPEGTHVKKGDLLVRLLDVKYSVAIDQSEAALRVARADLQQAKTDLESQKQGLLANLAKFEAEVRLSKMALAALKKRPLPHDLDRARMQLDQAKVSLENAQKNRDVLPELVEKGYITRDTLANANLKLTEAKAALQLARFNYETVAAGATQQELAAARIRVEQAIIAVDRAKSGMKSQIQSYQAAVMRAEAGVETAQAQIKKAEAKKSKGEMYAPRDGLVVYANQPGKGAAGEITLGMMPFQGQALIYLPDMSTMVADTKINEFDIGRIKKGGRVEVRPQAYPGVVFHGKVMKIGSLAKHKRNVGGQATAVKVFDVRVRIEGTDPRLKPGLTASVDFITEHQENVITVPLMSVFERGSDHKVMVYHDGKLEERTVVLGPSNETRVVVKDGLKVGDKVVLELSKLGNS